MPADMQDTIPSVARKLGPTPCISMIVARSSAFSCSQFVSIAIPRHGFLPDSVYEKN
jgi:hypothetical protein